MPSLDWINKSQATQAAQQVPYHLLRQEAVYGEPSENLLIQGDNLLALKALLPFYAGRVKCVFIDPPYNTQSAFSHYDDKLEHSQWLSMIYPRLVLLRELLAENGSIWITLDDNEAHYMKVLCDEVFGRKNFVANIIWQKRTSPDIRATIGAGHDHVLVYARALEAFKRIARKIPKTDAQIKAYKNPDKDPRGPWVSSDYTAQGYRPNQMYTIRAPGGTQYAPPTGTCWKNVESVYLELVAQGRMWFGKDGKSMPRRKTYLSEQEGQTPWTWWPNAEVGHNQESKKEVNDIFGVENTFDTPKPERLIQRILHIATTAGDIVLDSFAGSGTTGAVAHKMGRHYIGIEMGEHARTHCLPRLRKVIAGERGGISADVDWRGGGGFRFCTLGAAAFDADGRLDAGIDFATLAAFLWHFETGEPGNRVFDSPLLGIHNGTAYYLLYEDGSGNALTQPVLQRLKDLAPHHGPRVVYGETCRLGSARLAAEGVAFRQIPYDINMR